MRVLTASCLIAVACLAPLGCARPAQHQLVQIDRMEVGFPGAGQASLFKPGAWTPVSVELSAGPEGLHRVQTDKDTTEYEVVVATADSDNALNTYRVSLPDLAANQQFVAPAYAKPGSTHDDITVSVQRVTIQSDGQRHNEQTVAGPTTLAPRALEPADALYLSAGRDLPQLRQALDRANQADPGTSGTQYHLASIGAAAPESPGQKGAIGLPTYWFGYGAVDGLILPTGNEADLTEESSADPARLQALAEWVRRGGRLIISMGKFPARAKILLARSGLSLPVDIEGFVSVPRLDSVEKWLAERQPPEFPTLAPDQRPEDTPLIQLAHLAPKTGGSAEVLLTQAFEGRSYPLVIGMPCGMGQVTMVAFDLDNEPFTSWGGAADFWYKLLNISRPLSETLDQPASESNQRAIPEENAGLELATSLVQQLEDFPAVTMISFGWVALLLFSYVLVIGALDYLFLRSVLKRLELTWISFPLLVISVSVLTYVAAVRTKGTTLKINKIDVIDVDVQEGQAYGTTWFTLFSPQIQRYTIGIEPAFPPGPPAANADGQPSAVVSWLGRPDAGFGGYGKTRSQGFLRRAYAYAPGATGLRDVPVQIWSTKSFSARWRNPFPPDRSPVRATLTHPAADPEMIVGTITNRLPVAVQDSYLISGGDAFHHTAYSLGTLLPGRSTSVQLKAGDQGTRMAEWVPPSNSDAAGRALAVGAAGELDTLVRRILFYGDGQKLDQARNTALQYLDHSWRLSQKGQVILFGRLASLNGPTDAVTEDGAMPSRLWIGGLPAAGLARPASTGTMAQNTFIRMWIPIGAGVPSAPP